MEDAVQPTTTITTKSKWAYGLLETQSFHSMLKASSSLFSPLKHLYRGELVKGNIINKLIINFRKAVISLLQTEHCRQEPGLDPSELPWL